jgi:heme a synthase
MIAVPSPEIASPHAAPFAAPVHDRARHRAGIRFWLYGVAALLLMLVAIGGATRLTDSGLSITEWKPIHGVIPPLSQAQWQEELEKYRQIPEYQEINKGMSLDAFKVIYWWEWGHRFMARFLGLVFAGGLVFFWATKRLEPFLKPRLLALLVLGGSQGVVGWWMVSSGLTERTDVSQYRLAVHLTLASIILAAIIWVARGLAPHSEGKATSATRTGALWITMLVVLQIYFGGLVAGLDAGMGYATWPLMDGRIIPEGLLELQPWWINGFENPLTVQFLHRGGAYLLFVVVILHAIRVRGRDGAHSTHARRGAMLVALVLMQAMIGITTLLTFVPVPMALLHQAMGFITLGFAVAHWRAAKGPYAVQAAPTISPKF